MVGVGLTEMSLVNYLVGQLLLTGPARVKALREFAPSATDSDWRTINAGQRVQVIRPVKGKGGVLEFGTTVLAAADGSIAGLLGASPGASTAVSAMVDVLERCFGDRYQSWLPKLKEMVPSLGTRLSDEPRLFGKCGTGARTCWDLTARSTRHGGAVMTVAVAPVLGQGPGHRNALRAAEAARRGVRRRTGLSRTRNWTVATCCRKLATSGSKAREAR